MQSGFIIPTRLSVAEFSRIPAAGGQPETVSGTDIPNSLLLQATLSADGKTLALYTQVLKPDAKTYSGRIVLIGPDSSAHNIDVDPELHVVFANLGPPGSSAFHYSPDGKSVAFVVDEGGIDNVWMQPLDGSKGRKLTNFDSAKTIQDFRWSPDGKVLALLRLAFVSDVILLRNNPGSSRALSSSASH